MINSMVYIIIAADFSSSGRWVFTAAPDLQAGRIRKSSLRLFNLRKADGDEGAAPNPVGRNVIE
jgi:hypothetical protein